MPRRDQRFSWRLTAARARRREAPDAIAPRPSTSPTAHTFGTLMAGAGVPLRTLQHWMGHADAKTTQVYAHYQPSDEEAHTIDRAFGV